MIRRRRVVTPRAVGCQAGQNFGGGLVATRRGPFPKGLLLAARGTAGRTQFIRSQFTVAIFVELF